MFLHTDYVFFLFVAWFPFDCRFRWIRRIWAVQHFQRTLLIQAIAFVGAFDPLIVRLTTWSRPIRCRSIGSFITYCFYSFHFQNTPDRRLFFALFLFAHLLLSTLCPCRTNHTSKQSANWLGDCRYICVFVPKKVQRKSEIVLLWVSPCNDDDNKKRLAICQTDRVRMSSVTCRHIRFSRMTGSFFN